MPCMTIIIFHRCPPKRILITEKVNSGHVPQRRFKAGVFFHFHWKSESVSSFVFIAVFVYLCQCLKRAWAESASNKCFQDFKASNCSNRYIGDQSPILGFAYCIPVKEEMFYSGAPWLAPGFNHFLEPAGCLATSAVWAGGTTLTSLHTSYQVGGVRDWGWEVPSF